MCDECGAANKTHVEEREIECPVKGDAIVVRSALRMCDVCGEQVYDRELDEQTFAMAFDAYRQKHDIVSPHEIVALRERYGLTQRSLSALLGLGEVTIHRYEKGSLPDEAHNQLLKLLEDPSIMRRIFEDNQSRLSAASRRNLQIRLDSLLSDQSSAANRSRGLYFLPSLAYSGMILRLRELA